MTDRCERRTLPGPLACCLAALSLALPSPSDALAGVPEQARRLHDRLAGVPPSAAVQAELEAAIASGDAHAAAYRAMEDPAFYGVTLKNFAAPWTNRDGSVHVPLNDYTATIIGMIRDDVPFDLVLSADIVYVGADDLPGIPAWSMTDNLHYEVLEASGADLSSPDVLVAATQSALTDLPPAAAAGVLTTRASAEAFLVAGTNRALLRFTLMNHLCRDLEQVFDNTRPADRIRQDVSRSPGGDSRVFLANCLGCHAGMDPLAQAFAYYDYDELEARIVYTGGRVQEKYFNNEDTFPFGFRTPDDRWNNYWREGRNAGLDWAAGAPGSGTGAASLGAELAGSAAFARCQVEKVFRAVCLRDPVDAADRAQIDTMTDAFVDSDYRMKAVFADSAVYCTEQ